jgi:hypothetical protein
VEKARDEFLPNCFAALRSQAGIDLPTKANLVEQENAIRDNYARPQKNYTSAAA